MRVLVLLSAVIGISKLTEVPVHSVVPEPTFIAFCVGKIAHQVGHGRVTFEKTFLNIGGAYKPDQHAFIAPVNGVYFITFGGLNYIDHDDYHYPLYLNLLKNDTCIVSVYESPDLYGQGEVGIFLQLAVGDSVYVGTNDDGVGLYGRPDGVYSTFSGFLVAPVFQITKFIHGIVNTEPYLSPD